MMLPRKSPRALIPHNPAGPLRFFADGIACSASARTQPVHTRRSRKIPKEER
jgi:hypothetical protein